MRSLITLFASWVLLSFPLQAGGAGAPSPLRLHPDNPRYLEFRGRPTLLVTSGEHYGAVLNRRFDYAKYLTTLAGDGLNLTRVFSGAYLEPAGAFRIEGNTLAPAPGDFLAPWEKTTETGSAAGEQIFDLEVFSQAYFDRLRDFMETASRFGVVVEMNLFCPFYGEEQWQLSPMHVRNNRNGIGDIPRTQVYTLEGSGPLLEVQKAMVRKIVTELNGFDNLYYEICNEPYFGGVTLEWQYLIAREIVRTEARLPNRHLISRNVANAGADDLLGGQGKVWKEEPEISILNFHYSNPPLVVALNYGLNRVVGENETGFRGTGDSYYRKEAWEFLLAGGGLFNHLDYSFSVGFEDGTFRYPETQPGGGSAALRRQFGTLKRFLEAFDFIRMSPDNTVIRSGIAEFRRSHVLAESGRQYAIYLRDWKEAPHSQNRSLELTLRLPAGRYRSEWLDPVTGTVTPGPELTVAGSDVTLSVPVFAGEIALGIRAADIGSRS